jgi:arylformamidase
MTLFDLSPRISPRIGVFPGDTPFRQRYLCRLDAGANLDLSTIESTVHLGAHADAPAHYQAGAPGIAARSLDFYLGPCEVLRVDVPRGGRITPAMLPHAPRAPRVLLHTGTFPDPDAWNPDFAALSPALVHHLAGCGVRLVGIDTPSIDLQDDAALLSHQAVAAHDMAVLEGLLLGHVPPGVYELIALPLPIDGADASPVRAVLRPLPGG